MAYDSGYSRRSASERELQPVAIVSVDPVARLAVGATRTRHTVRINCAYATGDTITTPAVGEQWYCERFDMEWRLYGRIPFNDPTLNIEPEAGQVSVGSGSGPLELNGTEIRSNGKVFRLNGVYYRDSGQALERSTDQVTWEAITAGGLVQIVAKALADYQGATQAGAVTALEGWADIVAEVVGNFTLFWDLICGNVFVNGLRRLGVGETEVARIVDGFQNFLNYLFGVVFCDFTGDLTPQTILARLRDLLAPIVNNPFVQGLQQIAEILGVAAGNLLNDAVAGLTSLVELVFNIITCNWDALATQLAEIFEIIDLADGDNPFGPANIVKSIFNLFQMLGSPEIDGIPNPIGIFVTALRDFFTVLFESTGNLLEDALGGLVEFVSLIFGILTCDADALTKAQQVIGAITGAGSIFDNIVATLFGVLTPLTQVEIAGIPNPVAIFLAGLRDLYETITGNTATNLADGAIGGAVEFVRLIFRVITCDPTVISDLQDLVSGVVAGIGDPLGILAFLKPLLDGLLSNPLVVMIQTFAADVLGNTGTLLEQVIEGTGDLMNFLLKIVKEILPFDEVWTALLPFIDWDAVDAVTLPSLGNLLDGLDLWTIIFKPLDDLLGGAFTTFLTNLNSFFSGMGLLNGNFNPATAIDYFLRNVLGLVDNAGKIITDFLPAITVETLTGLADWFRTNFLGGSQTLLAWFQANVLGGLANLSSWITTNLLGGAASLLAWLTANVFGNVNPATFFSNLAAFLGFDLRTLGFNAFNAATAFLNTLFDPARGPLVSVRVFVEQFFDPTKGPLSPIFFVIKAVTDWFSIFMPGAATASTSAPTTSTSPAIATATLGDQFPSVTDIVTAITGLVGTTDIELGLGTLGQWARDIELAATQGFDALSGTIEEIISGILSVGMLNTSEPNLLTQGDFATADTVQSSGGWSWDNTVSATDTGGSARVVATGSQQQLYAKQSIKVKADDKLVVTAKVRTSGFTAASGREMVLSIIPWVGTSRLKVNGLDYTHVVHTRTASAATFQDMTGLTIRIGGTAAAGEVVLPSTVTSIQVRLAFTGNAGAVAWFDDVVVKKTGLVEQSWVQSLVDAFQATVGGLYGFNAPDNTADWTKLFAAAAQARGLADTGVLQHTVTRNTLGSSPQTYISNLFNVNADGSQSIGTLLFYLIDRLKNPASNYGTSVSNVYWAASETRTQANLGVTRGEGINQILFGSPSGGNNNKILPSALPPEVGAVGSGILIRKKGGSLSTASSTTGVRLGSGFYTHTDQATTSLVAEDSGGFLQIRATVAGWYMVEISFGITRALEMYQFYFNPVLYKNGQVYKFGGGIANAAYYWPPSAFGITTVNYSVVPEMCQSSFIVYMNANETVSPGYVWHPDPQDARGNGITSDTIIVADSSGWFNYFSMGLLNRSLA